MNNIIFRRLEKDWSRRLLEIQKVIFREILNKYHDEDINPANEDLPTFEVKVMDRDIVFGIFDKQSLIGFIAIREQEDGNRLCRLGLLDKYRGKGIAQEAIKFGFKQLNNGKAWELTTILQQSNLLHLYGKMGFEIVEGKNYTVNDNMTLIVMRKEN